MSTAQTVTLLVVVVLMFWVVGAYNRIVEMRNAIASTYAQVDAQLRRRYELLPRLVQVLRPRFESEQGTFDALLAASEQAHVAATTARVRPGAARAVASLAMAEQVLAGLLGRLHVLLEPAEGAELDGELASDVAELTAIEQQLVFARQLFNAAALSYNQAVHQFPTSMLAPLFRFAPAGQL
jgi:LemA protein